MGKVGVGGSGVGVNSSKSGLNATELYTSRLCRSSPDPPIPRPSPFLAEVQYWTPVKRKNCPSTNCKCKTEVEKYLNRVCSVTVKQDFKNSTVLYSQKLINVLHEGCFSSYICRLFFYFFLIIFLCARWLVLSSFLLYILCKYKLFICFYTITQIIVKFSTESLLKFPF